MAEPRNEDRHGETGREHIPYSETPNQSARTEGVAGRLGPQPLEAVSGAWQIAWRLVRSEPAALLGGGAIAALLAMFTFGILAGPMAWGMYAISWNRLRLDQRGRVGDVFGQFHRFWTSLGTVFLTGVAVLVGMVLLVLPGLYAAVAFMYALPLALDRNMGVVEAMRESRREVHATGFWAHGFILATLAAFGWLAGALLDWVGGVLTFVVATVVIASAYEQFIRRHDTGTPH